MATAAQVKAQKILQTVAAVISDSTPDTPRQAILNEASKIVHADRNKEYGDPEDNFKNIAASWNAYLGAKFGTLGANPISSQDIPIMMILMKTARLATNQNHHDSTVDIAGYAACLGDIQHNAQQIHLGSNFGAEEEFKFEPNYSKTTQAGVATTHAQDMEQSFNSMLGVKTKNQK